MDRFKKKWMDRKKMWMFGWVEGGRWMVGWIVKKDDWMDG